MTVVHGAGGVGKTTLVNYFVHEEEVLRRYSDGILWTSLGQQPNIPEILTHWIQSLGDYKLLVTNQTVATTRLRSLLRNKAILLVIDDVWDYEHLEPLLAGGERCHVVVTTRIRDIARNENPALLEVDVMNEEEAIDLLSEQAEGVNEENKNFARQIVKELSYLPLAVNLVGAQIKRLGNWEDFKKQWDQYNLLELSALQRSFDLSLNNLSVNLKELYLKLGVIRTGIPFSVDLVCKLQDQSLSQAKACLRELIGLNLLSERKIGGKAYFVLHDLLHSLIVEQVGKEKLSEIHTQLLNRYQKRINDKWHTVELDDYIHANLIWHLEKANCIEELHHLLTEETKAGHNGWFQTREGLGQVAGYIEDVNRAWRLAEESFRKSRHPIDLVRQCRYAFIVSTLNSLAKNIPPKLLVKLVDHNIWSIEQAIAYARLAPDSQQKGEALAKLTPRLASLGEEHILSAIKLIQLIDYEALKVNAISETASVINNNESEHLKKLLDLSEEIENPKLKLDALIYLSPYLEEALQKVKSMLNTQQANPTAYEKLVLHLAYWGELKEAQNLIETLASKELQASLFLKLSSLCANKLKPDFLIKSLLNIQKIDNTKGKVKLLINLARSSHEYYSVLKAILNEAKSIPDDSLRAEAFAGISLYLRGVDLRVCWYGWYSHKEQINLQLQQKHLESFACVQDLSIARKAVEEIKNPQKKAKALITIANRFPEEYKAQYEALELVTKIDDNSIKVHTFVEFLDLFSDELKPKVLSEAIDAAKKIEDNLSRAEALLKIDRYNTFSQHESTKDAVSLLVEEKVSPLDKARNLLSLLPYISDKTIAINTIETIVNFVNEEKHDALHRETLKRLINQLIELDFLNESLALSRSIGDQEKQKTTLNTLASQLIKGGFLREAFVSLGKDFRSIEDITQLSMKYPLKNVIEEIIDPFAIKKQKGGYVNEHNNEHNEEIDPNPNIEIAFLLVKIAAEKALIENEARITVLNSLAKLLVNLADKLLPPLQYEAVKLANSIICLIKSERVKINLLVQLSKVSQNPEAEIREAIKVVNSIKVVDEEDRETANLLVDNISESLESNRYDVSWAQQAYAEALSELALLLAKANYSDYAVEVAQMIEKDWRAEIQLMTLTELLPYIDEGKKEEVVNEVLRQLNTGTVKIVAKNVRKILIGLKPHLGSSLERYSLIFDLIHRINDLEHRIITIAEFVAILQPPKKEEVVRNAFEMLKGLTTTNARANALAALVPHLPDSLLKSALLEAQSLEESELRRKVLETISSRLINLPYDFLVEIWLEKIQSRNMLKISANRTREQMLSDIAAFTPLLFKLGQNEGVLGTAVSIQEISRWWP